MFVGDRMKKKILKAIWILLMVISIGVIVYAGIMLYSSYKDYKEVDDTNNEIIDTYTESSSEDGSEDFKVDWDSLLSINNEIVAWVRIPDTNINYPIMQSNNNNKYLRQNIYGNYSYGGSIFVDSAIDNPFGNMNTIVYGHNLNNGAMFANLKKYSDNDYASKHRDIYIYLPNGSIRIYKVFAFSKINANNYDIYNMAVENLDAYYEIISRYNRISIEDNIDTSNPILTLSTCTNHNEQERYVVQAYLEF